jgi:hypothetical protein
VPALESIMKNIPVFPETLTEVTRHLAFCRDGQTVVYFFNGLPVFSHHVLDVITFHMITAQFCVEGHAQEDDIVAAFGVEAEGVSLAVELYEDMGADGFYPDSSPKRTTARSPARTHKRKSRTVNGRSGK